MDWKQSEHPDQDYKTPIIEFFQKLNFKYFIIVEKDYYWHTKKIINRVFDNFQEANNVATKMNNEKGKFNEWDWEYQFIGSSKMITRGDGTIEFEKSEKKKPEKSYDERKQELGCRYDGAHYGDIEYIPFAVDIENNEIIRYRISLWNKEKHESGCSGSILYFDNDIEMLKQRLDNIDYEVKWIEIQKSKSFTCYESVEKTEFGYCFPQINNNNNNNNKNRVIEEEIEECIRNNYEEYMD